MSPYLYADRVRAWQQLLRVPNLLTVPGDPLAGFLLAGGAWTAAWPAACAAGAAALCLYAAGLAFNDLTDCVEDARDRPTRPLPCGALRNAEVGFVAVLLLLAGIGAAWCAGRNTALTAHVLAILILVYNDGLKHVRAAGPLALGLCRGLSLLLGATAAGWTPPATPDAVSGGFSLLIVYVAGLSLLARRETEVTQWGPLRWCLVLALLPPLGTLARLAAPPGHTFTLAAAVVLVLTARQILPLSGKVAPEVVQRAVGGLIQGLLPLQAALAAHTGSRGTYAALALLACGLAHGRLARRFYVT